MNTPLLPSLHCVRKAETEEVTSTHLGTRDADPAFLPPTPVVFAQALVRHIGMPPKNASKTAKPPAPSSKPSKSRRRHRPPSRRPASFASLPPELKEQIAEHICELDMAHFTPRPLPISPYRLRDEVAGRLMKEGKRSTKELARMMIELMSEVAPCKTGLASFSLINRECFLIARPILWQHLDLGDRTCESLLVFLRDILPRHAPLVKTLVFDHDSCISRSGLNDNDESYFPPEQKRYIQVAERMANLRPHRKLAIRRLRTSGVLIAEIIKKLVNLERVEFAAFGPEDYDLNEHWNTRWQDHAFQALVHLKPRLEYLEVSVDWDVRDHVVNLERLLSSSTELESLTLRGAVAEGDEYHPPYRAMLTSLARLSKLKRFTLELPIPPYFKQLDISWPLTSLRLDGTGPETPSLLHDFLSLFSSTLRNLEMRYVYADPDGGSAVLTPDSRKPTLSLPHLARLVVANSAGNPDTFLSPFAKSPLEILRIEDCSPDATEQVLSALETHKATLRKVQLLSAEYFMVLSETDRARVREWCEKSGVVYEDVEPEDSDDEGEGTEEDPSEFDSDGIYQYDYSDGEDDDEDDHDEEEDDILEHLQASNAARETRYQHWRREQEEEAIEGWVTDDEEDRPVPSREGWA